MIHVPLGFAFLMKDRSVNWCYQTEPEPELDYRKIAWPRGKVVGGTSAINGMVYIRGQREDYAAWAAAGNPGWSFEECCLPTLVASAQHARRRALHGSGGLWVDEVGPRSRCTDLFIRAGVSIGCWNTDFNGRPGRHRPLPVNVRSGVRQTATTSSSSPRSSAPSSSWRRMPSPSCCSRASASPACNTARRTGAARPRSRLVILCGGAINSPQLLELSGIGNPDVLGRSVHAARAARRGRNCRTT
jgi:choline dehydrogenase